MMLKLLESKKYRKDLKLFNNLLSRLDDNPKLQNEIRDLITKFKRQSAMVDQTSATLIRQHKRDNSDHHEQVKSLVDIRKKLYRFIKDLDN